MPIPIQNNVSPRSHHLAIGAACVLVAGILAWLLIARPATDSAPTGAVRDGVSVTATAPTATLVVGQQLAVKVLVDTREFSVSAVDLALAYDAKRLKIIGVKSGGFLPVVLTEGAAANGRAPIIIGSGTKPVSGNYRADHRHQDRCRGSRQERYGSSRAPHAYYSLGFFVDIFISVKAVKWYTDGNRTNSFLYSS